VDSIRYSMYVLMFVYGLSITFVAPMLDSIINKFKLELSAAGLIMTFISLGGIISILIAGMISDRIEKKKLIILGYLFFAVSMLLIPLAPTYLVLLILFFTIGFGTKVVDTLSNAIITDAYPEKSGSYLNAMHTCLGVGAVIGPILSETLLKLNVSFSTIFGMLGVLCLLLTFAFMVISNKLKSKVEKKKPSNFKVILTDYYMFILCMIILFYSGHQYCITVWCPKYFKDFLHANSSFASYSLAVYWLGIVISRFICIKLYNQSIAKPILVIGAALSVILLGIGIWSQSAVVLFVMLLFSGIFTGALVPIVMDLSCKRYPDNTGAISSLIYLNINIAPLVFPYLMGIIAERINFQAGFYLTVVTLFIMLVFTLLLRNGKTQSN